ncbi:DUF1330 domain-containing protein [Aureimonas ureilytica]|uniref:DUF1330 domain-containing protein n=1 Tax=Aureimonas ureilytica TaxID=401562 RepID=UPI00035C651B|nr:DUF1330 domain-containing protein [Aureimonas ureilytica]
MPKAYWIAHVDVSDPERYQDYVSTAAPAMQRHGAKFLARGGPFQPMEGQARARNVVIEFPSMDEALACYNSAEYQAAKAIRETVSSAEILIVEGMGD